MGRYVVLLRGINVGRGRQVRMAELRTTLEAAGGTDVATYIQSGNVVLTHPARSARKLAVDLAARITKLAGFAVPVAVRTAAEWRAMIAANPFAAADPDHLHAAVLTDDVTAGDLASLDAAAFAPEALALAARTIFLHLPYGTGKSKLAVALARHASGRATTVRNWRTVHAIERML